MKEREGGRAGPDCAVCGEEHLPRLGASKPICGSENKKPFPTAAQRNPSV